MAKMKFGIIFLILGIFLIGGGIYLLATQQPSGGNNIIPNTTENNSSSGNPAGGTFPEGTSPQTHTINIQSFAFSPSALTIQVGDTVTWTNLDSMSHTITSDSGTELSSSSFGKNGVYSHTFSTVGNFAYHCAIHSSMKGTITVE